MPPTPDLIADIESFSRLARQRIKPGMGLSPYGGDSGMATQGVVLHYSVSTDLGGTVRWFCDPDLKAGTSAHLVISRVKEPWHDELAKQAGTPSLLSLPATPVVCREVGQMAYHASWANSCYGIEMIGAGMLTQRPGNSTWAMGQSADGKDYKAIDQPVQAGRFYWQPQTQGQVEVAVRVVRQLRRRFPVILPEMILGHEHVQSVRCLSEPNVDKRDAGIGFPYEAFRNLVMAGEVPIGHLPFPERRDLGLSCRYAFDFPQPTCTAVLVGQLRALGYGPLPTDTQRVAGVFDHAPGTTIIKVFQRMAGLSVDGRLGPKTAQALVWRLAERGFDTSPAPAMVPVT